MNNSTRQEKNRKAGILVHPTSFPSDYGIGDFGEYAYRFIDFLYESAQSLWQILPLGPTGYGDSPYQPLSTFAGQTLLISPDNLFELDLLKKSDLLNYPKSTKKSVHYGQVLKDKTTLYNISYDNFSNSTNLSLHYEYYHFIEKNAYWLDDYCLFMALKNMLGGKSWLEWEDEIKFLDSNAKMKWQNILSFDINYHKFLQFIFYRQWTALKDYANQKNVSIISDIPIYTALDSADTWGNKELFQLNSKGFPSAVSGVPPDYFSSTGQLWGNPLYNWEQLKDQKYDWWIKRIRHLLEISDYIRIDHFRGFESFWSIPANESTAINGSWIKGPKHDLFNTLSETLGSNLPIIAEDLGIITDDVIALRDDFHFMGMKVLQFGFEDDSDNHFLPHNFSSNYICYTGTHDNDTTLGWYHSLNEPLKKRVKAYMNTNGEEISWDFIRTCLSSVANFAIYPLQDVLSLGSEDRMNFPGTINGNWRWRFTNDQLDDKIKYRLKQYTVLYGR